MRVRFEMVGFDACRFPKNATRLSVLAQADQSAAQGGERLAVLGIDFDRPEKVPLCFLLSATPFGVEPEEEVGLFVSRLEEDGAAKAGSGLCMSILHLECEGQVDERAGSKVRDPPIRFESDGFSKGPLSELWTIEVKLRATDQILKERQPGKNPLGSSKRPEPLPLVSELLLTASDEDPSPRFAGASRVCGQAGPVLTSSSVIATLLGRPRFSTQPGSRLCFRP